jgi:poly-beta-hydroxybutyrate-responsive repressor
MEPVLLLLLHRGASHGYDLVSALEPYGLGDVPAGPVYRTLRELEAAGLVKSEWDTESSAGPARRVYRLTEAGHHHLADWVAGLRETDSVLHHFLAAYDRHMKDGRGEHH